MSSKARIVEVLLVEFNVNPRYLSTLCTASLELPGSAKRTSFFLLLFDVSRVSAPLLVSKF